MASFADRLINQVRAKNSRSIVGLDPRVDQMPDFVARESACAAITEFHELVLEATADLIPAVKPQLAFYEQYGVPGMQAFENTVRAARRHGLLVIADGKRNDISSTAEAYANAYLGPDAFDCDAMTVTPYLGRDSLVPFAEACRKNDRGIFVVLKTSNPGSKDFEDQELQSTGRPLYEKIAGVLNELGGGDMTGESGYSSVGAVIGATFPEEGRRLRALMPRAMILVPGYGAQGGSAKAAAECFNEDGLGAVVSSSRGITYGFERDITREAFVREVREKTQRMVEEVNAAVKSGVTA
jgi:orotidine-5'-phosphate decarboxylase